MNAPFGQITVSTVFRYVLIIEWLDEDDARTGEALFAHLVRLGVSARLARCKSPNDLQVVLADALAHIGDRGIPAVHLETHGAQPNEDGRGEDGRYLAFGSNAAPGMAWVELGTWLAPLNVASDFRLIVVGAACFGLGVMAAMTVYEHAAPFAISIGMTSPVTAGSLRDAMFEFYRSLVRDDSMQVAIENANRELRDANEELRMASSPLLAYQIFRGVYDGYRTPDAMDDRVAGLLDRAREAGLPTPESFANDLPRMLRDRGLANMQLAWDTWFPPDLQAREPNYRFNYALVEA